MFRVSIPSTANAAFSEDPEGELIQILQQIILKLEAGNTACGILDSNGNRVGEWEHTPDDYDDGSDYGL